MAEHAPADHAHALEDAVAVEQTVIGHRDARLGFVHDLTVDPDLHGLVLSRAARAPRAMRSASFARASNGLVAGARRRAAADRARAGHGAEQSPSRQHGRGHHRQARNPLALVRCRSRARPRARSRAAATRSRAAPRRASASGSRPEIEPTAGRELDGHFGADAGRRAQQAGALDLVEHDQPPAARADQEERLAEARARRAPARGARRARTDRPRARRDRAAPARRRGRSAPRRPARPARARPATRAGDAAWAWAG